MIEICNHRLLVCLLFCFACIAHGLTPEQIQQLDDFIASTMSCRLVPGLNLALVKDGETVYTKGYGVSNMDSKSPVTEHTLFAIASITKSFTSTLLAMLLSGHSDVTWATPIRQYLPDFDLGDRFRTEQTNLHDLLSHKEGKLDDTDYILLGGFNITRDSYISHRKYMEQIFPFRSSFAYLNSMYAIAGYIAEQIGADTWENLIQERIFNALGMDASSFTHSDWGNPDLAESYVYMFNRYEYYKIDKSTFWSIYNHAPAGSIMSNAVDMTKYMKFILNEGKNKNGEQLVDKIQLAETHKPQNAVKNPILFSKPIFPVSDSSYTYGLGWINGIYRGYLKSYHTGAYPGFNSLITLLHASKTGIYAGTNGPYDTYAMLALEVIHRYASDLLLGEEPWLNSTTACTFPSPWIPSPSNGGIKGKPVKSSDSHEIITTRPPEDYTGVYGHKGLGNNTVYIDKDGVTLRFLYGVYGNGILIPTADELRFNFRIEGPMEWYYEYYSLMVPIFAQFSSSSGPGKEIDELRLPYTPGYASALFEKYLTDS
ncbi:uncharacterized protein LOC100377760 [Saccoglossus kowalevskii]|uniref:Beta-lactamase-like protein 2-like n=1 Tax=Saccoglossus kowalevskii TaxID=10224 RepID=A0ABM0LWW6_SACKO|nr:PREDICTED: beta-lactamase-like protein 2-like [Saccoglossus kowalevskii]